MNIKETADALRCAEQELTDMLTGPHEYFRGSTYPTRAEIKALYQKIETLKRQFLELDEIGESL